MRAVNAEIHENGRRVVEILADMKNEFVEFVETRVAMLRTELLNSANTVKAAIPLAAIGIMFLVTAFLLLTGAVVALVQAAFPDSIYRWFLACLIVGVCWASLGAIAAMTVVRKFKGKKMMPARTLEVLKRDKVWIQTEVRNRV